MPPRIDFYVTEDSGEAARLRLACRVAEKAYDEILSLPIHAGMTELDVDRVLHALKTSLA